MLNRTDQKEHFADFARATTVEQLHHLHQEHIHLPTLLSGVFATERREMHHRTHRNHPHPDQSHR